MDTRQNFTNEFLSKEQHEFLSAELIFLGYSASSVKLALSQRTTLTLEDAIDFLSEKEVCKHPFLLKKSVQHTPVCQISLDLAACATLRELTKNVQMHTQGSDLSPLLTTEDCLICLDTIKSEWRLSDCHQHIFCRSCVCEYIRYKLDDPGDIVCPGVNCGCVFTQENLYELLGQDAVDEKKKSHPDFKACPRPKCPGFVSRPVKQSSHLTECPACRRKVCFRCGEQWHGTLSCEEIHDKQVAGWAKGRPVKRCPNCTWLIEKYSGCDSMTCTACKHKWCWECQEPGLPTHFRDNRCIVHHLVPVTHKRTRLPPHVLSRLFPLPERRSGRIVYGAMSVCLFVALLPVVLLAVVVGCTYKYVSAVVEGERRKGKKFVLVLSLALVSGVVFTVISPVLALWIYSRYLWIYVCR